MVLKVGIIEDEELASETLELFLTEHCQQVQVCFMAPDLESGVEAIKAHRPLAIFLDIEMPGLSGMDISKLLREEERPLIVFTTAYAEYAVQAFGLNAVDYLLKPIDITKLRRALARVRERLGMESAVQKPRLQFAASDGNHFVDEDEVLLLHADGAYTELLLVNGSKRMISRTLADVEESLSPERFCRVHRSFTVNMLQVQRYERTTNGRLILKDGTTVPVARKRKEAVQAFLQGLASV